MYYLVQIYTAAFYAYLVPVGVISLVFIFSIQYWIDKYKLFNIASLAYDLNFSLTRKLLKLFEGSILAYASGTLLFSMYIQDKLSLFCLLGFVVAFAYTVFISIAPTWIAKRLFES